MANTPGWLGATAGQDGQGGQVNQFLGTHSSTWLYSGNALKSSQATGSGVYQSTQSQYLSQAFTTTSTQTTVGQVGLQISAVGGSPISPTIGALVVSIYADSGSDTPTGSALGTATVAEQVVYSAPFWLAVPIIVTGLSVSTVYHVVVNLVGTTGHYYAWQQSNQVTGAATSADGVTWTTPAYGLMYQIYDQSGTVGMPIYIYEDGGARIVQLTYTNAQLATLTESTTAQGAGNTVFSTRTISYSGMNPIGVS